MGELFGTDGIRAVAGRYPLDAATIERIGYALGCEMKAANASAGELSILIGRDTRESGVWIERALARGARASGASVKSAGVITTPGVAYLARWLGASAGVVISASHNPYTDNGIKVFSPSGRKLNDALESAIERRVTAGAAAFPPFIDEGLDCDDSLKERYLEFLRDEVGAGLDLGGLKMVIDCAEGAAYEVAPRLFSALGAEVVAIHAAPDGRNINLDCGSLHPEDLQARVVAEGAALGLAFDGDADRLLLVDETGRLLDGDYELFILAESFKARGRLAGNRIVATVMSNLGLEAALDSRGISMARASVGDKYVLEELLRVGGSLGGEQSGHIIFPEISLAGDGLITALELLRVLASSGSPLSALASGFTRYPQVLVNVRVARKPPIETVTSIRDAMLALDREMEGRGRLLVRYSGTENLARVMLEGPDQAFIERRAHDIADLIARELGAQEER
ncbi:MAG: phosphoglucosamine mutase [Acidobacteria bacterium]|nr:phosphoglucosamine mutase [Acidobacteriota bacterium]